MQLRIDSQGQITCVYDEMLDLAALGPLTIRRASYVEPDATGRWSADLAPVGGPRLGPFRLRSEALAAERAWLESHWCAPLVHLPFDGPGPDSHNHRVLTAFPGELAMGPDRHSPFTERKVKP